MKGQHCFIDKKGDMWYREEHYHGEPVLIQMYVRSTIANFRSRFDEFFEELQDIDGEILEYTKTPPAVHSNVSGG